MYSDFITVKVSNKVLSLGFFWPRPKANLLIDETFDIRVLGYGNGRRVRIVIRSGQSVAASTGLPRSVGEEIAKDILKEIEVEKPR